MYGLQKSETKYCLKIDNMLRWFEDINHVDYKMLKA